MIRKDYVLAMLVRLFFKYYVTGIVEKSAKAGMQDAFEPRNVKQLMLEHYEEIGKRYNEEVFYAIVRMNYEEATMEQEIRDFVSQQGTTDMMQLMRFACKTDSFYNTMVEEYKRNFFLLLEGRLATDEEHEEQYTRNESLGNMDIDLAQLIINRTISQVISNK
ncbi:MAG: hypothetical protein IKH99_01240 [Prevotella sp.]|nr:hypothetical protein [Prevotella sp.]